MGFIRELNLALHIILASLWVGGMLFMVLVVAPYIRKLPMRDKFFQDIGKRYQGVGTFIVLPLLFITGILNVHFLIGISSLLDIKSPYVKTLWHKLGMYIAVVILSLIHDLYTGPRSVNNPRFRLASRIIGLANMFVSIYIIYLASKLRFGG